MKKLAVLALSLLAASLAQAGVVNVNLSYNLASLGNPDFSASSPVTIANGDTVTLNVTFANNKALTVYDSGSSESVFLWLTGNDNNSIFTINNIDLQFQGFSSTGGAGSHYTKPTESSGQAHIGATFFDFLTAGQSVTFSGYSLSFTVGNIQKSPYTYNGVWIITGGRNTVGDAQQLPEPATLALTGLALAGLGAVRSRRNAQR